MERRILVVEDSPTQAEQLRLLLENEGYRVDVAGNGRKGLEQIQLEQPDLIISDVVMPEMDGYAFCQAVKSNPRTKRIPFVLLTQQNTPNDIVWGLQQGADNFITKPFDDDYLLERVRRIFENLAFREKGHLEVEVTLRIGNRDIVISADKQQIVELLFATFEDLKRMNDQLIESQQKVKEYAKTLEAANLELERASRFKSEFLANMSHELRTPLNSIIGFSELLEDQLAGPLTDKQRGYIHNVWTSGKHLLDLINDILDLSKVEAGKIELHMETFSLREALGAALTMVRPQAAKKRMSLRSELVPETTVTADPLRLKQIMYNLLSNAIKFTPEGGQVTVAARTAQEAFVEIAVTDTGIGIRAEDLPKLFREFSQVGGEQARVQHGTGLGLALSKRLVELHGGKIWAESEGENKGSTFTFTLPISGPTSSDKS